MCVQFLKFVALPVPEIIGALGAVFFGVDALYKLTQGAYKSGKPGKPGNLREFCKSGKLRENTGNLKCTLEFLEPTTISDKNVGQ